MMRRALALISCGLALALAACGSQSPHAWISQPVRTFTACGSSDCGPHAVTLNWSAIPLAGRTGYYVYLNGAQVADVNASRYTFYGLDCGTTFTLGVRAHDGSGNTSGLVSSSYTSPACTGNLAPVNVTLPLITGTTTQGQSLSASNGTWTGLPASFAYQWQRCAVTCSNIAGATTSAYVLALADVGDTIQVIVTASNLSGSTPATSARTAAISGTGTSGFPTSASTGATAGCCATTINQGGGEYAVSTNNLTISNTTINGWIYWSGTGTLTLQNDVITPNWGSFSGGGFITVWLANGGSQSLSMDHVTINGTGMCATNSFGQSCDAKGFTCPPSPGTCTVTNSNIQHVCQNDVDTGSFSIHDNYIANLDGPISGCHATPFEDEWGGTVFPRLVQHNTFDESPGSNTFPGSSDGMFVQNTFGPITADTFDNNFIHLYLFDIEISTTGTNGVRAGPNVTNNCFAPLGNALAYWSSAIAPSSWTGNTQCSLDMVSNGITIPPP